MAQYKTYSALVSAMNKNINIAVEKTAQEAKDDLLKLVNTYLTNDIVFMGIVKCSDGKPLNHIQDLNS